MTEVKRETKDVVRSDMTAEKLCDKFREWLESQQFGGIHTIIFIAADEAGTSCATTRRNDIPLDEHIINSQTATLEMISELADLVADDKTHKTIQ